ncbi:MAG: type II secretion system minor pseudopilin GspI [Hyphomonadaceae bacterium]|nr:type II secretion system minor pseudopilin GspI [Hyphomonadaceae bacterium]
MLRSPSDSGFSLIEALVALAVFAMAGVALVQLQTHALGAFAQTETRALADLAAQNRLTEIVSSTTRPAPGAREEQVAFAGRTWSMTTTVVETPAPETFRVSVAVSTPGAAPVAVAHAFYAAGETP